MFVLGSRNDVGEGKCTSKSGGAGCSPAIQILYLHVPKTAIQDNVKRHEQQGVLS